MRARMLIILSIVVMCGCAGARSRWEVGISLQVESQVTPLDKVVGKVELKTGSVLGGIDNKRS